MTDGNTTVIGYTVALPDINVPIMDKRGGFVDPRWYRFFETITLRTGGSGGADTDLIATNSVTIDGKADNTVTITVANGLEGGGDLQGDFTISALQDAGWTAGTGTPDKGAFATFAGLTAGVIYDATQTQALSDALEAATQRILALEEALRNNGGIGP